MKPDMYLITKAFPYGHGEDSFVKPEYPYLCDRFHVKVIVAELGETEEYVQDRNIEACIISTVQSLWDKVVSFLFFLTERDCYIEMAAIIRDKRCILKRMYRALMFGAAAETFYRRLKKEIGLNKNTKAIFYFYWFDYKCFGLTMHKHRFPNIKIVARAHGYDLYDERELYGKQFFKPQMDRELERLIFIAHYGKQYYLDKYRKQDSNKYPVHCLGVRNPKARIDEGIGDVFHIISCSNLVSLKRVELIIGGLSKITDRKIKWIHIGDGPELGKLQKLAEQRLGNKSSIEYEFVGRWSNEKVIDFYKERNINCFITTTETEGNPVSVQEALSFGIPVIATKVSDIPRMIDQNGILLSENPTEEEIADAIRAIAVMDYCSYITLRQNSYRIYCRDYNAENNHIKFIEDLLGVI